MTAMTADVPWCSGAPQLAILRRLMWSRPQLVVFSSLHSSWDSLNWIRKNQEKMGPTWHIGTKNDHGYWWLVMVSVCCHLRLLHWGLGTCVKVDALQHETTLPKQRCHRLIYTYCVILCAHIFSCKRYPTNWPYIIFVQMCAKRWHLPKFADVLLYLLWTWSFRDCSHSFKFQG